MYTRKRDIYKKEFSMIAGFQEKSETVYSIVETEKLDCTCYGIEVSKNEGDKKYNFIKESLSTSKSEIFDLLTLLYENSVDVNICESVIFDLIDSGANKFNLSYT